MAAKKDKVSITKNLAEELLSLLGVKAEVTVTDDKENDAVKIEIKSEHETGLLIGKRGETIIAIQTILGMMLRQKVGDWHRVIVEVGDWREKQEEYLKNLAQQTADRAIDTGEPQALYNLSASQRRIIHLELANSKDVETESLGEDKERYLLVKPSGDKKEK